MEGFVYVCNPPEIPKVAFGSGMERITLPLQGPGLSSFMRVHTGEVREFPGPSDYTVAKTLEKNYPSKAGFSVFASKMYRLPPTNISPFPPIGAYDPEHYKHPHTSHRPFDVGSKRGQEPKFLTPGPPTYPYHLPRRQQKICSAFGSHRIIWPEVAVFCSRFNTSKCSKCGQTPSGDYWHNYANNLDLCRPCIKKELTRLKHCSTDVFLRMRIHHELDKYSPMRYCIFFHDHNGTTAAMQLIPTKTLRSKVKKENYLYLYE